jgi:hypothetical protein
MLNARCEELLLKVWRQMHNRCNDVDDSRYGGRGISICREWGDYGAFRSWAIDAGYAEGLSIDRIDNNGNYAPGNCRWTDRITQANNRRNQTLLTAFGETKSLAMWARDPRCLVSVAALRLRVVRRGWDHERAIVTPTVKNNGKATHCPKGHPYDEDNIYWDGPEKTWRKCRSCCVARSKENYAKLQKGNRSGG